MLEAIGVLMGR